jgi:hypothetical protein
VTATLSGAVVTIAADARGAWGNTIALAKSSAGITLSGAALTGGADWPTGTTPDFDTGVQSFGYAADDWGDINAMSAAEQIVDSEFGFFAFDRSGNPVFKNTDWRFAVVAETPITIDNTHAGLSAQLSLDDVVNYVQVSYTPRRTLSAGTIAQAESAIKVPGLYGSTPVERWNSYDALPSAGVKLISLPFVDPGTGQAMGALSVSPIVPGVHYTVNERADGSGVDYTNSAYFNLTWAINGPNLELTATNTALGPLQLIDLYVGGVGLVGYDEQQTIQQNDTSVTAYGRKSLAYTLPLGSTATFAESLAHHMANRNATPALKVVTVSFDGNLDAAASSHLLNVEMFDLLALTDAQLGLSAGRYAVIGVDYAFDATNVTQANFYLLDVSTRTYWILGDNTYGVLGSTTRLGI